MKTVELYARVWRAGVVEGMSRRAAAREFGLARKTVHKMLEYPLFDECHYAGDSECRDGFNPGSRPSRSCRSVVRAEMLGSRVAKIACLYRRAIPRHSQSQSVLRRERRRL